MDHQEAVLVPGSRNARRHQQGVNEIVIFSVGSRLAVSSPCEENFILAKNRSLDGTKPGSSLLSIEVLLGRSPPGGAFWPSRTAGANPPLGRKSGFGYSGCSQRAGRRSTWAIDRTGDSGRSAGFQTCYIADFRVGRRWRYDAGSRLTLSSRITGYCAAVCSVLPYDHDDHLTQIA